MDLPIKPMLAQSVPAPSVEENRWPPPFGRPGWLFEPKLDGYRAVVLLRPDRQPIIWSRPGRVVTDGFPELLEHLGPVERTTVLDGEIIFRTADRRVDFEKLIGRGLLPRQERADGLVFAAFDILQSGDVQTWPRTLEHRKAELVSAVWNLVGQHFEVVSGTLSGEALWHDVLTEQSEGVIAKPLASAYRFGERGTWKKIKLTKTEVFRIVGWTPGVGARAGGISTLLLAKQLGPNGWEFAGVVGTGFDGPTVDQLFREFRDIQAPAPPFEGNDLRAALKAGGDDAVWLEPVLDGQVEFAERMAGGAMRFPSFKGLVASRGVRP